jgi:hypothetical protein
VVDGRVVPRTALLDTPEVRERCDDVTVDVIRRLLSYDASQRPTAHELWKLTRHTLVHHGFTVCDTHEED